MPKLIPMQTLFKIILCSVFFLGGCNSSSDNSSNHIQKKVIGHIGSFFKHSERLLPIVDYVGTSTNRIEVDEIYPNLLKLKSNYFAFGFWTLEERTIYAWQDFHEILSRLQKDRPDISLFVYVGDPTYGDGKHFCWDKAPTNNQCQREEIYTNYPLWAEKIADLNREFPIVKGLLIDDFMFSLATHESSDKLFTPTYLDKISTAGKNLNPDFRLEVVWYINRMSAHHAKIVSGHIDAVHGFYIHSDGEFSDLDPNRIVNEIEMFSRIFSSNQSSLVSIFREPDKPAVAGKKAIAKGIVDISTLEEDLAIAYWDSVNSSNPDFFGWNQVSVYFDDQLIHHQDIADGNSDNDIQILKIPYSTIQLLQNSGIKNAELRVEITTLKDYLRWTYYLNLFILSPENVPVAWSFVDEEQSYQVATNNDLTTPIDRYLGVYGGHLNSFEVTGEYTQIVLSHALNALNSKKIKGLVSWEVMMHSPESEVFSLYKDFFETNQ